MMLRPIWHRYIIQFEVMIRNMKNIKSKLFNRRTALFYMALPFVLLIFIFSYLPLAGWIYAFSDSMPGSANGIHFVGLDLFKRMFMKGSTFGYALRNTLIMGVLTLITTPIPVIFALSLAEVRNSKISRMVQTITSLPNFVSWVLVYGIFFMFFSSQGFVNNVLVNLGWIKEPLNVLANEKWVWVIQTLASLWKTLGWNAIIYIAALAGIDRGLYEAAEVDGAGRFAKIWNISIPGLKQTFFVLLLLAVGNILNTGFEQYYVFRNPSILNRIDVIDTYIYTQGITNMEFGYSTAVGMAKSLVSISLLMFVNSVSKKIRGETII